MCWAGPFAEVSALLGACCWTIGFPKARKSPENDGMSYEIAKDSQTNKLWFSWFSWFINVLCVSFQGLPHASCKGVHICKQRLRNLSDAQKGNDEWQPFLSMSKRLNHHAGVLHEMEGILMSVHIAEAKRFSSPSDFRGIAGRWKPCFDSPSPRNNYTHQLNCFSIAGEL